MQSVINAWHANLQKGRQFRVISTNVASFVEVLFCGEGGGYYLEIISAEPDENKPILFHAV